MRPLIIVMALLAAAPACGEERTWTISTGVFTAQAELVAVRGDLAYLKIGGKIEEYPLARLSAADQRYIASLSLAPVLPGPGDDTPIVATTSGVLATPGATIAPASTTDVSVLKGPILIAPMTEEAIPLPGGTNTGSTTTPGQTAAPRTYNYGSTTPPSAAAGTVQYRNVSPQSLSNISPDARRYTMQPQQASQQQLKKSTTAQQNQQDPPGILGIRARRNDRQRGR